MKSNKNNMSSEKQSNSKDVLKRYTQKVFEKNLKICYICLEKDLKIIYIHSEKKSLYLLEVKCLKIFFRFFVFILKKKI